MLRRTLFAALALTGVITLPAVSAGATTPRVEQGSFTFPVDEVDTELCGFPISIQSHAAIRFTSFLDAQGNPQRLILHFSIDEGTFNANGVSLRQGSTHNTRTDLFDTSGNPITSTFVGLDAQVFLPSGGVIIEAGRLVEDGLTGNVTFEAGKRLTTADLDALCGALSG